MSTYMNRKSLIGCALAAGLMTGAMDSKMNHEAMDHDSKTKKAD
ncbi:hypothetical protein NVV94_11900 [Pseudomonas sp. LS1212]|nr:hypothetical protein [Pseudomonas sp. LS1212]UVJ46174.1 hypothetical protein NVV94_11900 [Pseudomonas sp. LS1212]